MRVPAVSFVRKIAAAAAVGLLACGLALPSTSAFAEGKDAPSALLASSLMDGSASVVREDVVLAAPEDDAAPEPIIGSFTVEGLTFAVIGKSHVELVGVSSDWRQVASLQEGESSDVVSMLASGPDGAGTNGSALVLPESIVYNDIEYALTSIGAYAFYLSGVTSVELPATVTDVDDRAFRSSDVASVEVAGDNPNYSSFDGTLYSADQSSLLLIPEGKQGTVLLPKTAESAAPSVFSHCPLVTQVSVEEGSAAFASENGLLYDASLTTLLRVPAGATDITIREGCTAITAGVMEACASLAAINAPASVTSISSDVFASVPTISLPAATLAEDAPQLTAMVALTSTDDDLPTVDPAAVAISLPAGADATPWRSAGFSVDEPQGEVEGHDEAMEDGEGEEPDLPVASLGSASTYAGAYDFTIVNAEGSTLYQTNSSGSTNTQIESRVIGCGDASHQVHVRFLSKGGSLIVQLWHSTTSDNSYYRWVKPGYVLVGVKVTNGAGTVTDEIRATEVGTSYKGTSAIKGAGRTIAPIFEQITYNVTLNNLSATTAGTTSVSVKYNQAMPAITPPKKTGYRFLGYYSTSSSSGGTRYYDEFGKSAHAWDQCQAYPTSLSTTVPYTIYARWLSGMYDATYVPGDKVASTTLQYFNRAASGTYTDNIYATSTVTGNTVLQGDNVWHTSGLARSTFFRGEYDSQKYGIHITPTPKAGYSVTNWWWKSTGTPIPPGQSNFFTTAIQFGPTVTPNKYTVSFKANGGSGGQTANVTATYDAAMPTISTAVPVRAGYRFMGYYDNANYAASGAKQYYTANRTSARSYDKASTCTLYAGWKAMPTITFDGNGGTAQRKAKADNSVKQSGASFGVSSDYYRTHTPNSNLWVYSKESPIASEDYMCATRTGYTWQGWATSKTGTPLAKESKTINISSNMTLYAIWKANEYTVTLNQQGGSGGTTQVKPTYDAAMPAITIPVRAGYAFQGYYTAANGGGTQYYTWSGASARTWNIASNTTLYAKWKKIGTQAMLHVPNKSFWRLYQFDGVYRENDPNNYKFSPWDLGKNWFNAMRFYNGSVEVEGLASSTDADGVTTITGRQFGYKLGLDSSIAGVKSAWVVETLADGTHKAYSLANSAGWTDITNDSYVEIYLNDCVKYTLTWDANGGEVSPVKTEGVLPYATVSNAPTPTRQDYVFIGWYDKAEGGNYVCGSNGTTGQIAADTTLYAHWADKGPTVRIHGAGDHIYTYEVYDEYSEGNRKGPMEKSNPYLAGMAVSDIRLQGGMLQMSGAFTWKEGAGWIDAGVEEDAKGVKSAWVVATDGSGTKVAFELGSGWTSMLAYGSPVEVYLNDCVNYSVTWDANGGSVSPGKTDNVRPYETVTSPVPVASSERQGYAFTGWYTKAEEGELVCLGAKQTPPITGDVTYYAHWTPVAAATVPLEVTARVDLLGLEEQEAVLDADGYQGYIESRSGGALDVAEVAFEPLKGAEGLFGESAPNVFLEALPLWSHEVAGVDADVRFSLGAQATEADADHLAAFAMPDGFGTRVPVTYRFAIPEDVLSAIDPARFEQVTTPVCSVVYTVALQNPQT